MKNKGYRYQFILTPDAEHDRESHSAMVHHLFVVFRATAEKCVRRARVVLDARFVVVEYVGWGDVLQIGSQPHEKFTYNLGAHLRSAAFDVARLSDLDAVAPPLLK